MADGYSQVYGYSFAVVFGFWRHGKYMGYHSVIIATALTLFSGLLLVRNKKEEKEV